MDGEFLATELYPQFYARVYTIHVHVGQHSSLLMQVATNRPWHVDDILWQGRSANVLKELYQAVPIPTRLITQLCLHCTYMYMY